ncbi:FAD-dependent oxidoreductase [Granulicoccus phenolivorans]|uniref:FAD-dependent oxidoreductase n=1 Tax=Granulicoccus phenolivorans TaxID=266854 RepID=UPI0004178F35|nr:FAD-dependent oxidoreductase [Granulicoccus phenolivorans]
MTGPAFAAADSVLRRPGVRTLGSRADLADALAQMAPGLRLVVAGGGVLGSELVAAAVEAGAVAALVDPDPAPLTPLLGRELAEVVMARHRAHGVATILGAITGVRPDPEHPGRLVVEVGPKFLPADLVAVSAADPADAPTRHLALYRSRIERLGDPGADGETLLRIIAGEPRYAFRIRGHRLLGAVAIDPAPSEVAALTRLIESGAEVDRDRLCRPEIGLEDVAR